MVGDRSRCSAHSRSDACRRCRGRRSLTGVGSNFPWVVGCVPTVTSRKWHRRSRARIRRDGRRQSAGSSGVSPERSPSAASSPTLCNQSIQCLVSNIPGGGKWYRTVCYSGSNSVTIMVATPS